MINDILDGISLTLRANYPDHKVYTNKIPQKFKTPCFFVKLLTHGKQKQVGNYHNGNHQFTIRYYPGESTDKNEDCYRMNDDLYNLFHYLQNRRLHGLNISSRVVDEVGHFMVTYTVRARMIVVEEELLQDLEIRSDLIE